MKHNLGLESTYNTFKHVLVISHRQSAIRHHYQKSNPPTLSERQADESIFMHMAALSEMYLAAPSQV